MPANISRFMVFYLLNIHYLFEVSLLKVHIAGIEVSQEVGVVNLHCFLIVSHCRDHISHVLVDNSSVSEEDGRL